MNRYETLSSEYTKSYDAYQAYVEKCRRFCAKFTEGLAEFLECPPDRIVPMVKSKEGKYEKAAAGDGHINDKGFFVNLFVILVPLDPNDVAKKPDLKAICHLEVKAATGDLMEIKLECLGDLIHEKVNDANVKAIYGELAASITQTFQNQNRYVMAG